MVGNGFVSDTSYVICGAASESIFIILTITFTVTLMVLIAGIVFGTDGDSPEHRFLRRKPLLLPSITFVITMVLVIALVPHPMAQYHGPNEVQMHFEESDDAIFRVYDGIAYRDTAIIYVNVFLEPTESILVVAEFYQNETLVASGSIEINATLGSSVSGEFSLHLEPGLYEVRARRVGGASWVTHIVYQPLVSGFLNEVLMWESYRFMLIVGSFFFFLAGLCVGREDRKRYSYERIDQEPPKDGAEYARRA